MAATAQDEDRAVRRHLADLLDRVVVRAENGFTVQGELSKLAATSAGERLATLLAKAQGVVGEVNASAQDGPGKARAFAAVTALKTGAARHELKITDSVRSTRSIDK